MVRFKVRRGFGLTRRALAAGVCALCVMPGLSLAQQTVNGFAVERFYPSAPGAGWFVMDDLSISGGPGGAIELTSGYARNPLKVPSLDGAQPFVLVANEAFVDVGLAGTYDRYRLYLNIPMPYILDGSNGTLGPYQFTAPAVTPGTNPDTVADPRLGFDVRIHGEPGSAFRLGAGAQLIFPAGDRFDYVTDARYRGMLRLLAAGDSGAFLYAGQIGIHLRPLNDAPVPGSPQGKELLFGGSAGRRFPVRGGWAFIIGPEIFGETAFASFFARQQTGLEALLTSRLETTNRGRNLRIKVGLGHGLVENFGAPQWRVLVAVELFGHHPRQN